MYDQNQNSYPYQSILTVTALEDRGYNWGFAVPYKPTYSIYHDSPRQPCIGHLAGTTNIHLDVTTLAKLSASFGLRRKGRRQQQMDIGDALPAVGVLDLTPKPSSPAVHRDVHRMWHSPELAICHETCPRQQHGSEDCGILHGTWRAATAIWKRACVRKNLCHLLTASALECLLRGRPWTATIRETRARGSGIKRRPARSWSFRMLILTLLPLTPKPSPTFRAARPHHVSNDNRPKTTLHRQTKKKYIRGVRFKFNELMLN